MALSEDVSVVIFEVRRTVAVKAHISYRYDRDIDGGKAVLEDAGVVLVYVMAMPRKHDKLRLCAEPRLKGVAVMSFAVLPRESRGVGDGVM